jgi:hypothetical protein
MVRIKRGNVTENVVKKSYLLQAVTVVLTLSYLEWQINKL